MWIEELDVRGFGRLRHRFEFACGVNLIVGPNEAGKSTLHELLVRVLFGYSGRERRHRDGESKLTVRRPWDEGAFGAVAVVREATDGRDLRIEWDFGEHSVVLRDQDTGNDLSGKVRGKRSDVALGPFLLGIDRDEFRQVCCLDQAAIDAVKHSDGLVGAIQEAVEAGPGDGGVASADTRLADVVSSLGVHARHYTPLATGRLSELTGRQETLDTQLATAEAVRDEVAELAARLRGHELQSGELDGALARIEQAILLATIEAEQGRLQRAAGLAEKGTAPTDEPVAPDQSIVTEIRQIETLASSARQAAEERAPAAEAASKRLPELEGQRLELQERIGDLETYRDVDASARDAISELVGALGAVPAESEESEEADPTPGLDPDLAGYERDRERLHRLAARPDGGLSRMGLAIAAAVAVASVIGALIHPAALAGLLIAALIIANSRHSTEQTPEVAALLERLGATSLGELDTRLADHQVAIAMAQARSEERLRQREQAAGNQETRRARLAKLLDEVSAPAGETHEERATAHLRRCEQHASLQALEGELHGIARRISDTRAPVSTHEQAKDEIRDHERKLAELYPELGIDATDLQEAAKELEARLAKAERAKRVASEAKGSREGLAALLGGETIQQIEARVVELESRLREEVARKGELTSAPSGSLEALTQQRDQLCEKRSNESKEITELQATIDERERTSADPAELREQLAEVKSEIGRVEQAKVAIQIARNELRAAADEIHREFAPHLNDALERYLPRITNGRYKSAAVGNDLSIRVTAPETGSMQTAQALSRGTQDQIFLVERLAIAALLQTTAGSAPLLLDDPFARFDQTRLRLGVDLIGEVATSRQVFLFFEDENLIPLVRESYDANVVKLPTPPVSK